VIPSPTAGGQGPPPATAGPLGTPRPLPWDLAHLEKNVSAFELLVLIHYRYYKCYSNMGVALLRADVTGGYALGWRGLVYLLLAALFLLASRDALRK
jgi:hypothetical protein